LAQASIGFPMGAHGGLVVAAASKTEVAACFGDCGLSTWWPRQQIQFSGCLHCLFSPSSRAAHPPLQRFGQQALEHSLRFCRWQRQPSGAAEG